MKQEKCECNHMNPYGTILCESCGRPVNTENTKNLLEMRYEGSARRSQTYNKTIVDKIWNFFSSVKVGVWLIGITLVASALGTIYPQEMYIPPNFAASEYYEDEYGWTGRLYYELGFHNLYGSWWYIILIASIAISLVIASVDRFFPLYRALKRQGVKRNEIFLKRQRLFGAYPRWSEKELDVIRNSLVKRRYKVREENGNILAEKGRFSRWGPYVNHVGLIIFLIGAMLRFVPGMYVDEVLWLRDGETKAIPGTDGEYYLKNKQFIVETYDKSKENEVFEGAINSVGDNKIVKNFQANVTLYERNGESLPGIETELKKIKDYEIRVNEPLKYNHYALYQVDYKPNELSAMSFNLIDKHSKENYGVVNINLQNPKSQYELGRGYRVELLSYFPDFIYDDKGQPSTKSRIPNNPAFIFKMFAPDRPKGEVSFVAIQQTLEPLGSTKYKMKFVAAETLNVTGLTVRKDFTLWILGLGGAIFMIGVIQGMYWNHRRVWVQRVGRDLWIAGHTNKNWYGFKQELNFVLKGTTFSDPEDQIHKEKVAN